MSLQNLYGKASAGERLTPQEGLRLLQEGDLLDVGAVADSVRRVKNPQPVVTFVVDTNPNYTNVCNIDCIFCAFYRHEGETDSYTFSVDEMIAKFKDFAAAGVTTVLLQGGVNPKLPFDYYLDMVRRTRAEVPEIHPHFFFDFGNSWHGRSFRTLRA